ncbi:MAG: SUMF1/EgtB/PvdO family nonheme iron enzyme, partial [Bacteroidales bacterium]|nr:SUMF1/EgtB/PvdO family nonheme iron enzyme [Bacteroidales bacterium]
MSGAESYCCNVEGKKFSVEVERLKGGVDYYYCYEYDNGYNVIRTENKLLVCKFTVNGVSFTMIAVEGGTFQMGATSEQGGDAYNDEKPVHSVTLSDYYIGETEVTQELWTAVMGSNPSSFSNNPQRPVEQVSWNDCQEFIKK